MKELELWGGVECTVNRVGDTYFDQMARSGHTRRPDDIDRFAALGITTLRYPLLWEHLAPESLETIDWTWADDRLRLIKDARLSVIAGLVHHGSGPRYTSLVDARFPTLLAQYARAVAERYPWISDWTPVNEPLTTARFSGLYGHWYPHGRDNRTFIRALLHQVRGIVLAMGEVRQVNPAARLVQTEDLGLTSGTPALRAQVEFENHRRWLSWDLLCGRVGPAHPLYAALRRWGATEAELGFFQEHTCAPDVIGVNYYVTSDRWIDDRLHLYDKAFHGGNSSRRYADVEAVRARGKGIIGHERHLLSAWRRYRRPIALTEVHLGCAREEQMRWLSEAWRAAERARSRGADIRAVTAWSLLGSHEWDSLVTAERGHYEAGLFDVRGAQPRRTGLAAVAQDLARGRRPAHPVLSGEGWWRRPSRLIHGPAADSSSSVGRASGAPILVIGHHGTLGRAFKRLCEERNLRVHTVARAEVDICDRGRIDAVLRRLKPWAVINAAGYVRVDDAESDRDACWRDNVTGPVNLAAACRLRCLPLVTFSSDLVFDGSLGRSYREEDPTAPLNAYGASKAEAERRVLELLPSGLVIRTSAFFSPWDTYNFAAAALRCITTGQPFRAADDSVVSPTYVPDLVHSVLELLIDGERGIWHLANKGELTWFDFARLVVREAGADASLIERCSWRDVWQPAVRPKYSALDSSRGALLRPLEHAVAAYVAELNMTQAQEAARCASS